MVGGTRPDDLLSVSQGQADPAAGAFADRGGRVDAARFSAHADGRADRYSGVLQGVRCHDEMRHLLQGLERGGGPFLASLLEPRQYGLIYRGPSLSAADSRGPRPLQPSAVLRRGAYLLRHLRKEEASRSGSG